MRLKNTSRYDTEEARELIEFGMRGVNTAHVAVHLKNSQHAHAGMSYDGVPGMARTVASARDLITLRLGAPEKFPREWQYAPYKRAPRYTLACWHEALVALAAHEAHHHKVRLVNRRRMAARRAAFARGAVQVPVVEKKANSEVAAERWALKRLTEFRTRGACCFDSAERAFLAVAS